MNTYLLFYFNVYICSLLSPVYVRHIDNVELYDYCQNKTYILTQPVKIDIIIVEPMKILK